MVCRFCGNQVADGTQTCPYCNAQLVEAQPVYQQPAYQQPAYQNPAYQQPAAAAPADDGGLGKSTLIFGIIGIVLSEFGLLGLIFSLIGKKKAKEFQEKMGQLYGTAKIGSILSTVGLIISIIMLVFWAIYIIVMIVAMVAGMSNRW